MRLKNIFIPLIAAMALCGCGSEPQKGVNYYLDATEGSDSNEGTSPDKPWKSFARIDSVRLAPGDSLLLKRGSRFDGLLELKAKGSVDDPIVVGAYGDGEAPCIVAPDSSLYAVAVRNSDYVTLENLEVINKGSERLAGRTGVLVECRNYGVSHNIVLRSLYVHDVNGSLVKAEGGGSAILIRNGWDKDSIKSAFDGLTIENCVIRRCERNALIWSAPCNRKDWLLSKNTVVRSNLIEEVPGDGIVPISCDSTIVEYNLMRDCPMLLPDTEAAAGIWPWSCDNTVIRFNEASGHKAPWDAQGFDCDYNCTNTLIEYNYSHDNDGGFILICNDGDNTMTNIGNIGSVVRYNISYGDAVRQRLTRAGVFSPTIHIAGPCDSTLIENNIFLITPKPSPKVDRHAVISDSWGGFASRTTFRNNLFYAEEPSAFNFNKSTGNLFDGNYFFGKFSGQPSGKVGSASIENLPEQLPTLLREVPIANGKATLRTVDKEAIEKYFRSLEK